MDEKFLEFWGNFLLNAARGKKQTDNMFRWMQTGFPNLNEAASDKGPDFRELTQMFRKLYGLEGLSAYGDDYKKMSEKALEDFQKSFKEYLSVMGIVSQEEHLALVEKYENLKTKCAQQEESIKHLKMLLSARGTSQTEFTTQLESMVKNQGELFRKIMTDFGQYYDKPENSSENTDREKTGKKKE
ncbi:MAG: hypothetical protein V2I97_09600 [Desulfococcaceae bacterium]|jgi:hypothetical protein|nr:hypothetical protein [Desulfococcaceae bacterium]